MNSLTYVWKRHVSILQQHLWYVNKVLGNHFSAGHNLSWFDLFWYVSRTCSRSFFHTFNFFIFVALLFSWNYLFLNINENYYTTKCTILQYTRQFDRYCYMNTNVIIRDNILYMKHVVIFQKIIINSLGSLII